MIVAPRSTCERLDFSAAGFIATRTLGRSPGVAMSREAKWIWKLETPARLPAGARISAGKLGSVARSLPKTAVASVKRPPASCIPSPESPAKRTMTRSRRSTFTLPFLAGAASSTAGNSVVAIGWIYATTIGRPSSGPGYLPNVGRGDQGELPGAIQRLDPRLLAPGLAAVGHPHREGQLDGQAAAGVGARLPRGVAAQARVEVGRPPGVEGTVRAAQEVHPGVSHRRGLRRSGHGSYVPQRRRPLASRGAALPGHRGGEAVAAAPPSRRAPSLRPLGPARACF